MSGGDVQPVAGTEAEPGTRVLRLQLAPDPRSVRVAVIRTGAELQHRGIPAEAAGRAELLLAEVLNNVAEHAFAPGVAPAGQGRVQVTLRLGPRRLRIEVRDDGAPMPGGVPPPGLLPSCDADGGPSEGGYGWFLIRTLAEEISYERLRGCNRLRFSLPIAAPKPS